MSVFPGGVLVTSPVGSVRSAGGSGPVFFQISLSALDLGACEIFHVPFISRLSVSYIPLPLLLANLTGLQSQVFWALVFPVQHPQTEELDVWTLCFLGRTSLIVIIFSFVGR